MMFSTIVSPYIPRMPGAGAPWVAEWVSHEHMCPHVFARSCRSPDAPRGSSLPSYISPTHLEALGWTVITIWECELKGKDAVEARIDTLAEEIRQAGERRQELLKQRKLSRSAARKERNEILARQAKLEAEIKSMYSIPRKIRIESEIE